MTEIMTDPKTPKILPRVLAKSIDLVVMLLLASLLPRVVGPIVGVLYCLLADGARVGKAHSQSLGKFLLKLQVLHVVAGEPKRLASLRESTLRNLPFAVPLFFGIIPGLGWIIAVLVGVPVLALELALLAKLPTRQRLGDAMADTRVVWQVRSP